jgi:hypothetical protein
MGFDIQKFETADYKAREKRVPVPELKAFFGADEAAEWVIRSLTGAELASVRDSVQRAKDMESIIDGLASGGGKEKIQAVKDAMGIDGAPDDHVRRLTMLELGTVSPKVQRKHVVKLSEVAPVLFTSLTTEIMSLTGQGKSLGESIASGGSQESKQASPSAPGADLVAVASDSSTK